LLWLALAWAAGGFTLLRSLSLGWLIAMPLRIGALHWRDAALSLPDRLVRLMRRRQHAPERGVRAFDGLAFAVLIFCLSVHEGYSIMVWALLNQDQNVAISELIDGQKSDRIVAIIGGVLLDDSLRCAIEQRLRFASDMNEKLFKVGGPLGNTAPKIDLGYQLYMFEKPMRNTMYGLTEIKNLFAHRLDMTFANKGDKFKQAVAKLALHTERTHYPTIDRLMTFLTAFDRDVESRRARGR
jgi:hypothetical protein